MSLTEFQKLYKQLEPNTIDTSSDIDEHGSLSLQKFTHISLRSNDIFRVYTEPDRKNYACGLSLKLNWTINFHKCRRNSLMVRICKTISR